MSKEIVGNNIREVLPHLIGQRLVDLTQEDQEDRDAGRDWFIEFLFEKGDTLKIFFVSNELYKARCPMTFSDPDKETFDHFEDGYFHPTAEEEESHGWIAIDWRDENGIERHIVPTFGKHHWLDGNCWCNPDRHFYEDESNDWRHNPKEEKSPDR